MEFSIICQTSALNKYASMNRVNFVLANVFLCDSVYQDYYTNAANRGVFTILDNGAYEGELLGNNALIHAIKLLQPDVAILPDLLMGDWLENCSRALGFLDKWQARFEKETPYPEFMFVPQVPRNRDSSYISRDAWMESVSKVCLDPRVGHWVKWLGFGRYLHTEFVNLPHATARRVDLAKAVRHTNLLSHLKFHALGMADGDVNEFNALRESGLFKSCDSSAPVWRGCNGYDLTDRDEWRKKGTPIDFNAPLLEASQLRIELNLIQLGVIL